MTYQWEKKKVAPDTRKDEFHFKEWKLVEVGAYHLFSGKKLSNSEFVKMFQTIRSISTTEVGTSLMVSDNYKEKILKQGMQILRDEIKEKPGHTFLVKLGETWTYFYTTILPILQSLFYSIPMQPGVNLKQMTMVSFRDIVLLPSKIDDSLSVNEHALPKSMKQMCCVLLQATRDNTDNYTRLDTLSARVINPLLGTKGLHIQPEKEFKEPRYSSISEPEVVVPSGSDTEFEELMNYRHQTQYRFQGGGLSASRLSFVDENNSEISESLASLIADGFEIG